MIRWAGSPPIVIREPYEHGDEGCRGASCCVAVGRPIGYLLATLSDDDNQQDSEIYESSGSTPLDIGTIAYDTTVYVDSTDLTGLADSVGGFCTGEMSSADVADIAPGTVAFLSPQTISWNIDEVADLFD
jgi:hypothetical protein